MLRLAYETLESRNRTYLALGELERALVPANLKQFHEALFVGSAADDVANQLADVLHASSEFLLVYGDGMTESVMCFNGKPRKMARRKAPVSATYPLALSRARRERALRGDVPLLKSNGDFSHGACAVCKGRPEARSRHLVERHLWSLSNSVRQSAKPFYTPNAHTKLW